jgi:hypothetical protein
MIPESDTILHRKRPYEGRPNWALCDPSHKRESWQSDFSLREFLLRIGFRETAPCRLEVRFEVAETRRMDT